MKKTIMLACAAGMSTSLMVNRMKEAANKRSLDVEIIAVPAEESDIYLSKKNIDVVLLGPQVRYMKSEFENKLKVKNIPLDVMSMSDYGTMNGEKILEQALRLMSK